MKLDKTKEDSKDLDEDAESENNDGTEHIDIMAQQLKFVACLKILMEELSTLATGFEVDGNNNLNNLNYYTII